MSNDDGEVYRQLALFSQTLLNRDGIPPVPVEVKELYHTLRNELLQRQTQHLATIYHTPYPISSFALEHQYRFEVQLEALRQVYLCHSGQKIRIDPFDPPEGIDLVTQRRLREWYTDMVDEYSRRFARTSRPSPNSMVQTPSPDWVVQTPSYEIPVNEVSYFQVNHPSQRPPVFPAPPPLLRQVGRMSVESTLLPAPKTSTPVSTGGTACVVCTESAASVCLVPCGHLVLCNPCVQQAAQHTPVIKCPMCRQIVTQAVQTYVP